MSRETKRAVSRSLWCGAATAALLVGLGLSAGPGCRRDADELLVTYSGNSQAYIEPCG